MSGELFTAPGVEANLCYPDLVEAAEWLTDVFGFSERREARLVWPSGGMTWLDAGIGSGNATESGLVNIKQEPGFDPALPAKVAGLFGLKIYVKDVDTHHAHAAAKGAQIVIEPEDGFWGGRRYQARDHVGYIWEFAQVDRDLAPHLWKLHPGMTVGE